MNRLTAMIIQSRGDDIVCDAGGPSNKNGKWVGWIILYRNGEYDHELLSSDAIFDTDKKAIAAMENVVKVVRELDLDSESEKDDGDISQQAKNSLRSKLGM